MSTQANNITAFLVGLSALFIAGIGGYVSGYEVYATHYTSWEWWRNFLMIIIPIVGIAFTWWFGYSARFNARNTRSNWFFYGMMVSVGYSAMWIVWEIVVWRECNNLNGLVFVHPHCANPLFPVETEPKIEFFLTFFGAVAIAVAQFVCVYFANTITCIALYQGSGGDYETINTPIGAHMKGHTRRSSYDYSSSDDDGFTKSVGKSMFDD